MRDDDILTLVILAALLVFAIYVFLAFIAGNIVSQLFAPVPSVAGPLGAAAALIVFLLLLGKTADLLFG